MAGVLDEAAGVVAAADAVTASDDADHAAILYRALCDNAHELLVRTNRETGESDVLAIDARGVWGASPGRVRAIVREAGRAWAADRVAARVREAGADNEHVKGLMATARAVERHASKSIVLDHASSVRSRMETGELEIPKGLTLAYADEMDAFGYLGTEDGIVRLADARLLVDKGGRANNEARGALATKSAGGFRMPPAEDEDLRACYRMGQGLFGGLDGEAREFAERSFGWTLRRQPSRRILLVLGEPNGGKSTLVNAIVKAMGGYGAAVGSGFVTQQARYRSPSGHTAGELPLYLAGLAYVGEASPKARYDTEKLKSYSGTDLSATRNTYEVVGTGTRTELPTATMVWTANPDAEGGRIVPAFDMTDEGLMQRLMVIEWPTPADPDPQMMTLAVDASARGRAFRAGLLHTLIAAQKGVEAPPEPPASVLDAARAMQRDARGGEYDDFLTAAFEHTGVDADMLTFKEIENAAYGAAMESGEVVRDKPFGKSMTSIRAVGRKVLGWPSKADRGAGGSRHYKGHRLTEQGVDWERAGGERHGQKKMGSEF